jgi:hypothetical protein
LVCPYCTPVETDVVDGLSQGFMKPLNLTAMATGNGVA